MAQPAKRYEDDGLSVIEDLDPEEGGGLRIDLLVGIPLLLVVIAFVGWNWWHTEYQTGRYRAGQEAAGRNDWETAAGYFTEASGYSNADAMALGAKANIEKRDLLYKDITFNSRKADWLPVLRDIREIAEIQPGYKDIVEREQDALDGVYSGILSGTVAMRIEANPAGLYLRTPKGWTYLKGSDIYSALQVAPDEGKFVYDAPDPGWQPTGITSMNPGVPGSLRGRHLVKAEYAGTDHVEYLDLTLDPSQYTSLLASKDGIWGIHYGNGGLAFYDPDSSVVQSFYSNSEIAYQPYSNDTIQYAPLPPYSTDRSRIVALDENSNRYLMAEWSGAALAGPTENTIVNVYLVTAGSNAARIVYTLRGGGIISAQFGPTGRYLLIHTFDARGSANEEKQSIVLVDLEAARSVTRGDAVAKATTLREVSHTNDVARQNWLGTTFVPGGAYKGDIVLTEYKYTSTSIQVLDPVAATKGESGIVAGANVDGSAFKGWVLGFDGAAALRIMGYMVAAENAPDSIMDTVVVAEDGTVEVWSFQVPASSYPMFSRRLPSGFAWANYQYVPNVIPSENNVYINVYSAQHDEMAAGVISPTVAYSQGLQHTQLTDRFLNPSIVLGNRFFAYTHDNKLHLRSYDGKDDLILESGVQSISEQIQYRATWTYVR